MKNNQVHLDPDNLEESMRQLDRFYRLDDETMNLLRRIVERYPKPVIMYVDEANAPLMAQSPLDDHFTFNADTGELVLFSADPLTFVDALIEMWMYISGFDTQMGAEEHWKIEFAIGAWKPVKNNIKKRLGIPVIKDVFLVVGLPPTTESVLLEDNYPFKTLVSTLNRVSFEHMIRYAGREDVRVQFPESTSLQVVEVYFAMRNAMQQVGAELGIEDVDIFNQRLHTQLEQLEKRFNPAKLPEPRGGLFKQDKDAASDATKPLSDDPNDKSSSILLGPSEEDEISAVGRLPSESNDPNDITIVDMRLRNGPFANFIDTLFED